MHRDWLQEDAAEREDIEEEEDVRDTLGAMMFDCAALLLLLFVILLSVLNT